MDCLIAIPCFRESKRLPLFLDELCKELAAAPFKASIVIVDDGSGRPEDAVTRSIVDQFRSKYPTIIGEPVFLKRNLGKGGAVYAGWKTSSTHSPRNYSASSTLMARFLPQRLAGLLKNYSRISLIGGMHYLAVASNCSGPPTSGEQRAIISAVFLQRSCRF
jgi:glycosyltransferase involved in cell wall biosynthesis